MLGGKKGKLIISWYTHIDAHTHCTSHSALFLSSVKEHNTIACVNHINRAEICQLDYSFNKHHNHCLIFFCQCDTSKCQITIHDTIKVNILRSGWIYLSFKMSVMSSLHCLISYLLQVGSRSHCFLLCF